jgi:protein-arginine kinase activator protein McsA
MTQPQFFNNFKVPNTDFTLRYWNISNTREMEEYIKETCPEIAYNQQYIDLLVKYEFEQLVKAKMERMKLQRQSKITEITNDESKDDKDTKTARDILYSA